MLTVETAATQTKIGDYFTLKGALAKALQAAAALDIPIDIVGEQGEDIARCYPDGQTDYGKER